MTGKDSEWTKQAEWIKTEVQKGKKIEKKHGDRRQRDKWIAEGDRRCLFFLFGLPFLFSFYDQN